MVLGLTDLRKPAIAAMLEQICLLALNDDARSPVALARLLRLALDHANEQWRNTPYGAQLVGKFTPEQMAQGRQWCDEPLSEPDPGSPFFAWRLSWRALEADTPEETRVWVERAIDAFATIIDEPRDPGNDLGPFTAIAELLDVPQLRRAAHIVSRMETWPSYERSHAWAALVEHFAARGELDEAEAWVRGIGDADVKALATGYVSGERARRGHALASTPCLPLPQYLDGITRRLARPTVAHLHLVWSWLTQAPPDEHALRALSNWFAFGASETWRSFIARANGDGSACTDLMFELATLSGNTQAAEHAVRDALATDEPTRWLDELYDARHALSPSAYRQALVAMLAAAARPSNGRSLGTLARTQQLASLLKYAGAPLAVVRDVLLATER